MLSPGLLSAQAYFAHADWAAACDQTRTCTALALPPIDAERGMRLTLLRGGGPREEVAWIDLFPEEGVPVEGSAILFADEEPLLSLGAAHMPVDGIAEGRADLLRITGREELERLLAALRRARRLVLVSGGRPLGEVSAEGASAVFLWIDERQLRLHGENALVRRGEIPAHEIPEPPPAPRLPRRAGAEQIEGERAARAITAARALLPEGWCEPLTPEERSDRAFLLADRRTILVGLDCARGFHNQVSRWFLVRGAEATPLRLRRPAIDRTEGRLVRVEALNNAQFHPLTGELVDYEKARALGDCGRFTVFRFDGEGFALAEDRHLTLCRGASPDQWPLLWSSLPD
ncbi:MAG: DUF1176 domain-containing protein [Xanthomonadales bacterium]|nr:DUF1176 domain-containing protein [Xanthomonadales bacterium]